MVIKKLIIDWFERRINPLKLNIFGKPVLLIITIERYKQIKKLLINRIVKNFHPSKGDLTKVKIITKLTSLNKIFEQASCFIFSFPSKNQFGVNP